MAGEVLLSISRDEVERARLESEYKYELDQQSFITGARREGKAAGKAAALAEVARKMKQDGLGPDKIREYTQLSLEEIRKL